MITKEQFLKRATAKNIKQMRGHDAPSYEWDIYFDNKKICNCWDDSYGGELQITNYDGKSIEDIFKTIDKESLYNTKWKNYDCLEIILSNVKTNVTFAKDEVKGVCIGFSKYLYQVRGFQYNIAKSLETWSDTKQEYEKMIIKECQGDKKVLNFEYLSNMGINVPMKFRWNEDEYIKNVRI